MSARRHLQSIIDLAGTRLNNPPLDPSVAHDLREILRLATEAHRLIDGRPYPKTGDGST